MKIVLNLQFLTCKKYSEHRSTVKNCNFSKLQFFKCTSTVIPLHIFAVYIKIQGVIHKLCLKFGFSEKHSKFEKNLLHGFDKPADLLSKRQNHEEDFFKICVLLRKSKLYTQL